MSLRSGNQSCKACDQRAIVSEGYCYTHGIKYTGSPYHAQPRCRLCSDFLLTEFKVGLCPSCDRTQRACYTQGISGYYGQR